MKPILYQEADQRLKNRIRSEWGEIAARHMHLTEGFSLVASLEGLSVGLISVYWRALPPPLEDACEGYVDIIEVLPEYRRRGVAAKLVELAAERARNKGAHQLRAWSSEDKTEAILMWRALGFGLCPAKTYPKGQEINGFFVTLVL